MFDRAIEKEDELARRDILSRYHSFASFKVGN